ncbi:MAG TPA: hypothetical protein VGJ75_23170, partial [Dongiaceae bacterium]
MTDRERRRLTLVDKHAKEHCPLVQLRSIDYRSRAPRATRRRQRRAFSAGASVKRRIRSARRRGERGLGIVRRHAPV